MRFVLAIAVVLSATSSFASEQVVSKTVSAVTPAALRLLKKNLSCSNATDRGGRPMAMIRVDNVKSIARAASPSVNAAVNQLFACADNCNRIRCAMRSPKALSLVQVIVIEKTDHVVPEGVPGEGSYCRIRSATTMELKSRGRSIGDISGTEYTDIMDWTKGSCDQF